MSRTIKLATVLRISPCSLCRAPQWTSLSCSALRTLQGSSSRVRLDDDQNYAARAGHDVHNVLSRSLTQSESLTAGHICVISVLVATGKDDHCNYEG